MIFRVMTMTERQFGVWLKSRRIGGIILSEGVIRFKLRDDYIHDASREVLGLFFENSLPDIHRSRNRLPPWFSNLLPEGKLREWIAREQGINISHELGLIAGVGHDLPGAVSIAEAPEDQGEITVNRPEVESDLSGLHTQGNMWHFSLAGVAMKFSLLQSGDRFTSPGVGEGGDWIIKLPDHRYPNVPLNEFSMMRLAHHVGLNVPEVRLIHRDQLPDIPGSLWPASENMAYAIRRFDRTETGERVHIEDFAQVRGFYPENKYKGSFETLGALVYRRRDSDSLVEFAKRLAFNVVIGNGDAHLKNWSLIYTDPRRPVLAPAYDLVATAIYRPQEMPEDLGLKFAKSRQFASVSLQSFERLERKIGASDVNLRDEALDVIRATRLGWQEIADDLAQNPWLREMIGAGIDERSSRLMDDQGQQPLF
jgi:serine/threonine-protein kinase HipA